MTFRSARQNYYTGCTNVSQSQRNHSMIDESVRQGNRENLSSQSRSLCDAFLRVLHAFIVGNSRRRANKVEQNQLDLVSSGNFSCKWRRTIASANQRLELCGNPMTFNDVMPIFRSHERVFPEQVQNLTSESRSIESRSNFYHV